MTEKKLPAELQNIGSQAEPGPPGPPSTKTGPEGQGSIVDLVWDTMTGAYGATWTNKYGDHDRTNIWSQAISKYHPAQIKNAIAAAIKFYTDPRYLPTLGQFLKLCSEAPKPDGHLQLSAPQNPATKEEVEQWRKDLKELRQKAKLAGPLTEEQAQYHNRVLGLDQEEPPRYARPGTPGACVYPGCTAPGAMTTSLQGARAWYCSKHFRS